MSSRAASPIPGAAAIPRVFHRVWIGGAMPAEYVRYGEQWLALHPGWTMRTWSDADLDVVEDRDLFDRLTPVSAKSNLLRYSVLWRHGGVYLDTDFEPLSNIEPLLDGEQCVVGEESPGLVASGFIACVPGHPVLRAALDGAAESFDSQPELTSPYRTGPQHFTRSIRRARAATGCSVKVLSRDVLYPYTFDQHDLPAVTFPASAAVHRWAQSWVVPPEPPTVGRTRRLLRRTLSRTKKFVRRVQAAWERAEPVSVRQKPMQSAYLGNGRVLMRMHDGTPIMVGGDDLMVAPALAVDGELDAAFLRFVSRELRRGDVAVDVGASIGLVTLTMARAVGATGRVFAFEPNGRSASLLGESLYINSMRGPNADVVLTQAAVGSTSGSVRIAAPSRHRGLGHVVSPDRPSDDGDEVYEVPQVALDEVLIAVPFIRFVKIDVEGYESQVLAGMQRLIAERRIGAIDIELDDRWAGSRWAALVAQLRSLESDRGARFYRIGADSTPVEITLARALHTNRMAHLLIRLPH